MISAVIFDMDGLLVDSEPYWQAAEIEVFGRLGVALTSTMCLNTVGLRIKEVVRYWYARYPWPDVDIDAVASEIVAELQQQLQSSAVEKLGVTACLTQLAALGVPLAVCSSSDLRLIETVVKRLEISDFFTILISGSDCQYGKPHPESYLKTAQQLGVQPQYCLVFEDSLTGCIAGKAAGMTVIAVPESHNLQSSRFDFCDLKLASLQDFDAKNFNF